MSALSFVIDANVLWSTAYRAASDIGQFVLLADPSKIKFYSPEYLKVELDRHFDKIVSLSGQSATEVSLVGRHSTVQWIKGKGIQSSCKLSRHQTPD